ncbi:MAG: hypothetical protein QM756_40370 [Polyangiaceae bacterium]
MTIAPSSEPPAKPLTKLPRWFGEPLLHFVVLGAAVFAIDRALVQHDSNVIGVPSTLRAELASELARNGHPASEAALELRIAEWKQTQALYREGLRQGVVERDPSLRSHVADAMRALLGSAHAAREPSPAELDAFFERHRALYELPLRYDFRVAEMAGRTSDERSRAEAWLKELERGGTPVTLAPQSEKTIGAVQMAYGPGFALALRELPLERYSLLESERALYIVFLERKQGGLPETSALRERLRADFLADARQQAQKAAIAKIVGKYRFEAER